MADDLLPRIEAAAHALHGARKAAWRSPNADTMRAEQDQEEALDLLLKLLWSRYTPEQRAAIDSRPIRKLVTA